ncbi:MAG: dephospho-CoA kinase [Lawsonibacter sp.]|nr:dephospho-CoA kinase [Lawsonibacter sp.]
MTILGITGPTGAGKTTLLKEVERLGGAVIDCDRVYHEILETNTALQNRLEKEFGPLRDEGGSIDRKKLGRIVFRSADQLELLNAIVGQAITSRVVLLLEEYRKQGNTLAAIDAIALLESPLKELCQLTVAVLAPPEVRVRRIMAREGIPEDYAWARIKAQQPDEYFIRNCSHTLLNDCTSAEEFTQKAREFLKSIYIQSL